MNTCGQKVAIVNCMGAGRTVWGIDPFSSARLQRFLAVGARRNPLLVD